MSSLLQNRGWLCVQFRLDNKNIRLYLGLRDTRQNRRSPLIKEVFEAIDQKCWAQMANLFPSCKALQSYRTRDNGLSFRAASERFLEYQKAANSRATVDYYRAVFTCNIWPTSLGEKELRMITPGDVTALMGEIRERGHVARANKVRQAISAVFNWARREHDGAHNFLAKDNPVDFTKPLRVQRTEDDINPFSDEEVQKILHATRPGWERRFVIVAIETGLRPSENAGLKRANVDFAAHAIYVRQNVSRWGEGALKTSRSRRTVDMTNLSRQALQEQIAEVQLRSEWLWPHHHSGKGPHSSHNFSRRNWPVILKRAGVRHREFYQCRHTFATRLLHEGADWDYIADQMGHRDLSMLHRHYWKWRPGTARKPASRQIANSAET